MEPPVDTVKTYRRKKPRADSYPRKGVNKALALRHRLRTTHAIEFLETPLSVVAEEKVDTEE